MAFRSRPAEAHIKANKMGGNEKTCSAQPEQLLIFEKLEHFRPDFFHRRDHRLF
jgi:hypothetical protein